MSACCETPTPSRRAMLVGGGAMFAWAYRPRLASAAGARDPRLIVIVLRGALDGLATVAPVVDPSYERLHGQIALSLAGEHPAIPLDSFFALHPAMPVFARQYKQGHAAVVHATATGYRERSHFDGQDVLESGYAGPGIVQSGWLNRAIGALPRGEIAPRGLAIGPTTALIMRGPVPVLGWAPQLRHRRPTTSPSAFRPLRPPRSAAQGGAGEGPRDRPHRGARRLVRRAAQAGAACRHAPHRRGRGQADGRRRRATHRRAVFRRLGHARQRGRRGGRLAQLLGGLDSAFEAFEQGLGERWKDTTIVAVTEFGRTARINGTVGTDHGTGTVALLAGGAVKGGRVIADWPGLKDEQLYERRDLKPTTDLRAVLKGLLAEQFDLSPAVLSSTVFPQSEAARPLLGLTA